MYKKLLSLSFAVLIIISSSIIGFTVTAAQENVTTIIACSDFQPPNSDYDKGSTNVKAILDAMKKDGITSADAFFCVGDFTQEYDDPYATRRGIILLNDALTGITDNMLLVQGNHDCSYKTEIAGLSPYGNNDAADGSYGAFIIHEEQYDWYSQDTDKTKQAAKDLEEYLNEKLNSNFSKPIFVLNHIQLEYTVESARSKEALNGRYIFEVLNKFGEKGLNIIFMRGHNHGNSCCEDVNGGSSIFLQKGDTLKICKYGSATEYTTEKLNFTYLTPGYIGYYAPTFANTDSALTMTVYKIYDDRVVISRYDKNGRHNLKSEGKKSCEHYPLNSKVVSSPFTLPLKKQLTPTKYSFINGNNSEWTSNSKKDLNFVSNGNCLLLSKVSIDNTILDMKNYSITSEPLNITISQNFLSSLSEGSHKISLEFIDGNCQTSFSVKSINNNSPTNNSSNNEVPSDSSSTNSSKNEISSNSSSASNSKNEISSNTSSANNSKNEISSNTSSANNSKNEISSNTSSTNSKDTNIIDNSSSINDGDSTFTDSTIITENIELDLNLMPEENESTNKVFLIIIYVVAGTMLIALTTVLIVTIIRKKKH